MTGEELNDNGPSDAVEPVEPADLRAAGAAGAAGAVVQRSPMADLAYRVAYATLANLRWGPLRSPSGIEQGAIDEFRQRVTAVKATSATLDITDFWVLVTRQLAHLATSDDPRKFFAWNVIQANVAATINPSGRHWLRGLRDEPDFASYWKPALRVGRAGRPATLPFAPLTTTGRLAHAHHLATLRNISGRSVADMDLIVEFGGGVGGMAQLARQLGFTGRYVIIDLPVMRELQRFFLTLCGIPSTFTVDGRSDDPSSITLTDLAELDSLAVDRTTRSLFIATWSLSESPLQVRAEVLRSLNGFTNVLVAYQRTFEGIDNTTIPEQLSSAGHPELHWEQRSIRRAPDSHYVVGWRASAGA